MARLLVASRPDRPYGPVGPPDPGAGHSRNMDAPGAAVQTLANWKKLTDIDHGLISRNENDYNRRVRPFGLEDFCSEAVAMSEGYPAATIKRPRIIRTAVAGAVLAAALVGFASWNLWQGSLPARLREQLKQAAVRGRWQEVESLSAHLTERDPRDGEAWMMRARAAHAQGIQPNRPGFCRRCRPTAHKSRGPFRNWRNCNWGLYWLRWRRNRHIGKCSSANRILKWRTSG